MKKHFTHHYEILPEAQRTVWPHLAQFKEHFVLYGGTAIALRLGHRQSIDFDFFSEKPLEHRWIADILPETVNSSILQSGQNTYTVLLQPNDEYVKLSFFGGIDFGRIGEPVHRRRHPPRYLTQRPIGYQGKSPDAAHREKGLYRHYKFQHLPFHRKVVEQFVDEFAISSNQLLP